jgi:hypothetical protein
VRWRLRGDGEDRYRTLESGRVVGTVYPPRTREGDRLMRSAGAPRRDPQRIGLDDGPPGTWWRIL